jgi:hypothetical protein
MAYILLLESASILAFLWLARAGAAFGAKFYFCPFPFAFQFPVMISSVVLGLSTSYTHCIFPSSLLLYLSFQK